MATFLKANKAEKLNYEGSGKGYFVDINGDEWEAGEIPMLVLKKHPDTSVCIEVKGGYMCFTSYIEYENW